MNTIEMHGLITGKCVAGDMKVNESVAEYLVRKISNIEDQRNAALNTCTLIAEALGITGAVAGDTIAKVQQLVAENAGMKKSLNSIANAEEFHGDTVVCDFDTLVTVAWSALKTLGNDEFAASLRSEQNV